MAKHHERIILPCFNICTFAIFDPYAFRKRSLEYEEDVVCFHDHTLPGPAGSVIRKTASGAAAFSGVPFNAILLDLEMVSGRPGVVCQARCRQQLTHPERAFSLCATHNRRDCRNDPWRDLFRTAADLSAVQSSKYELVINASTARMLASPCRRRCSPSPTR